MFTYFRLRYSNEDTPMSMTQTPTRLVKIERFQDFRIDKTLIRSTY
jgi:hypothetical protein